MMAAPPKMRVYNCCLIDDQQFVDLITSKEHATSLPAGWVIGTVVIQWVDYPSGKLKHYGNLCWAVFDGNNRWAAHPELLAPVLVYVRGRAKHGTFWKLINPFDAKYAGRMVMSPLDADGTHELVVEEDN